MDQLNAFKRSTGSLFFSVEPMCYISEMRKLLVVVGHILSGLRFRLLLLVLLTCTPLVCLTLRTASEERRRQITNWSQRAQKMTQLAVREEEKLIGGTRQLLLAIAESA